MDLGLKGRSALVCGASRGIGRAIAVRLHEEGAGVTLVARSEAALEAVADSLRRRGGAPVSAIAADLTDEAGRAHVAALYPAPDILVNNGGGVPTGHFSGWGRAEWQRAVDVMMLPPIEMTRLYAPGMMERRFGRIVNVLSRAVKSPHGALGLSTAVRTAVAAYSASIARELIGRGVTINSVLPGIIDSDAQYQVVTELAERTGRDYAEIWAARAASNPAGRFGMVEEVSAAVAYFAGVPAGFVTNQHLLVDGGDFTGTF